MRLSKYVTGIVLAGSLTFASLQCQADLLITPGSAASADGDSALQPSINYFGSGTGTCQFQIAASQLSSMNVGSLITGLSFRLSTGGTSSTALTYADYEITLAAAANNIASISDTFADNMSSPIQVRDGALSLAAGDIPGGSTGGNPNPFSVTIAFDSSYTYQGGDLVIYLAHSARTGGGSLVGDGYSTSASGFGTEFNGRLAGGFQTATATVTRGAPIQLEYTPAQVPEPSVYALSGLGLLLLTIQQNSRKSLRRS